MAGDMIAVATRPSSLGMVLVDALNGLWVARMRGSRVVSATIGLLCLAIAASALAELELAKPLLSVGSIAVVVLGYLVARYGSRYGTAESKTR